MSQKEINKLFNIIFIFVIISIFISIYIIIAFKIFVIYILLIILSLISFTSSYIMKMQNKLYETNKKKIVNLEMECYGGEAFLKKLMTIGVDLISEQEHDALIKKIKDAFDNITKASSGYLMMYNQNKNIFEWGIGINLSTLKMKEVSISPSDSLMGRILSDTSNNVLFHDVKKLYNDNLLHIKSNVIQDMLPSPDILMTIRLKMKESILGIQFLFVTDTQAEYIKKNLYIFNSFINMITLALGSAVQREFAINDRMTMMYNHEYFISRLTEEIALCRRTKGRTLSLLMIDIDHFKKFNDTYGHQIGDIVLIETAKVYKECVRISDIVARYGGEEFTIILPETSIENAVKVAEKIRSSVEAKIYKTDKGELHVTISIGVCELFLDAENSINSKTLFKKADEKLYECKAKGRNRVCY